MSFIGTFSRTIPVLFLSAVIIGCEIPPVVPFQSGLKVIKVIDGDTVRLSNGKLLRYIGIDTPEVRHKTPEGFVYQPQAFSLEAKELNRQLVEGKPVRIEYDVEKSDKYERALGYCFVQTLPRREVMVNELILEEGLGVLLTMPPNVKYVDRFVQAQTFARAQKKGIWATYEPIRADEAAAYIGKIAAVQGRVSSCYDSGKAIFLNFGGVSKTGFTAVIFKKDAVRFQKKGIFPCSYRGKRVEVLGKVKEYRGPEIIVRDPSQITVIEDGKE